MGFPCFLSETTGPALFEALEFAKEFDHPMALVPAHGFLELYPKDVACMHEGLREAGRLKFLNSRQDALAFKRAGNAIIFLSYECLAWGTVGPNRVQLEAMKMAVEEASSLHVIGRDSVFVWLDCLSVPQVDGPAKEAAIGSIHVYARAADVLVVVCPDSVHETTGKKADRESVKRRFWCRVEQVMFGCQQGTGRMYLHDGREFQPIPDDWMDSVCCVWDGEATCCRLGHSGFSGCDKTRAVVPLLSLCHDVHTRAMSAGCTEKDSYAWSWICQHHHRMFSPLPLCTQEEFFPDGDRELLHELDIPHELEISRSVQLFDEDRDYAVEDELIRAMYSDVDLEKVVRGLEDSYDEEDLHNLEAYGKERDYVVEELVREICSEVDLNKISRDLEDPYDRGMIVQHKRRMFVDSMPMCTLEL